MEVSKWRFIFRGVMVPPCRPLSKYHNTDDMFALHAGGTHMAVAHPLSGREVLLLVLINQHSYLY